MSSPYRSIIAFDLGLVQKDSANSLATALHNTLTTCGISVFRVAFDYQNKISQKDSLAV
jgi:hypothetical protein